MIVATGPQGIALETLKRMVAITSAFRQRREKYTVDEALLHVYAPYVDDPYQVKRPFCVCMQGGLNSEEVADRTHRYSGTCKLLICDDTGLYESAQESLTDFTNFVDGLVTELSELSGLDDLLHITSIRQTQEPMVSNPKDMAKSDGAQKPFWITEYAVEWSNFG